MALVNVCNMVVLDNPTKFAEPFRFEVTFECLQELEDDLEWRVLYVGHAQDQTKDLVLDEILVGPVPVGINKFVLQADAPDPSQLEEPLGVTVVLVTCSYRDREFVRVGYYVNNEYQYENHEQQRPPPSSEQETPQEEGGEESKDPPPLPTPPQPLDMNKVLRQILADKPRVTKFPIPWGDKDDEQNETTHKEATTTDEGFPQEPQQDESEQAVPNE